MRHLVTLFVFKLTSHQGNTAWTFQAYAKTVPPAVGVICMYSGTSGVKSPQSLQERSADKRSRWLYPWLALPCWYKRKAFLD